MEHIKRCKVCGHIFCYTDKDVQDQTLNAVSSIFSGMAQIGAAASGSILNMHMAGSQAERVRNQQVDLNRCPNCNSTDLEIITKEELQKIAAAEALKNGADIKINANASTESLLKRAEIFLEDSDWPTANAYCNAVLDVEPDNAEAYLGKMMAELQITKREKLADLQEPFDSNDNYKKIIRFGSEELVNEVCGYVKKIKNERQYKSLKQLLDSAKTEGDYINLASKFKVLAGYKDSEEISAECFQKAEVLKEERERKAEEARIAAEKAKIEAEKARIAAERKAEADRIAAEARMRKSKKIVAVILPISAVIIIAVVIFATVIQPQNEYNAAVALMEAGKYEEAIIAFEAMNGYKDSAEQIVNCENIIMEKEYQSAVSLMNAEKYEEAISVFELIENYSDSSDKIIECKELIVDKEYEKAIMLFEKGNKYEALRIFGELRGYKETDNYFAKLIEARNTISAGIAFHVFIEDGGTVFGDGSNNSGQLNVSNWSDIISVGTGILHTVGLKSDGTVVAVGSNYDGECNVSGWTNIVAISVGDNYTVGLKSDGTVVLAGSVLYRRGDVSEWENIIAIDSGDSHIVGLKFDGTIVATGLTSDGQCDVSNWRDIIAISGGERHTVGLKSDGTVVATGDNTYGQCDVSGWTDIVAIAAGFYHTVGLKADGTVVATGNNGWGQCDILDWTDIVEISAGGYTIGRKSDGTVVKAGS